MFKRPLSSTTSPRHPLRSSSLRKLRAHLLTLFPSSSLTPALLALLLPEGTSQTRLSTHLDEKIVVYSQPDGGDPMFFSREGPKDDGSAGASASAGGGGGGGGKEEDWGELIPTIYAVDLLPSLFAPEIGSTLVTNDTVISHLLGGASLFSPGISTSPSLSPRLNLNTLISIESYTSLGQADAIGYLLITPEDLKEELKRTTKRGGEVGEGKGKVVGTIHVRGDALWKLGSGVKREPLVVAGASTGEEKEVVEPTREPTPPPPLPTPTPSTTSTSSHPPLTPESISTLLLSSLYHSLSTSPPPSSQFPLSAAALYASHVLPFRPAWLRDIEGGVDKCVVKNSSYKSVAKLFVAAKKAGVLRVKEGKTEVQVLGFDERNELIQSAPSYRTLSQSPSSTSNTSTNAPSSNPSSSSPSIIVRTLLSPTKEHRSFVTDVLGLTLPPPSYLLPTSTFKAEITKYIKEKKLTHPGDGKYCILDESLLSLYAPTTSSSSSKKKKLDSSSTTTPTSTSTTSGKKGVKFSTEEPTVLGAMEVGSFISKEELWNHFEVKCCSHFWGVDKSDGSDEVVKKGSPPTLLLTPKTVGKRVVTLLTNYETWFLILGLKAEDVVEEFRTKGSCSAYVGESKSGERELGVQGQQEGMMKKVLEEKGVPKKFVEVSLGKLKK